MALQLELFSAKSELDFIKDEIKIVKESNDKVRRSLFARHADLWREFTDLKAKLDQLEQITLKRTKRPMIFQS